MSALEPNGPIVEAFLARLARLDLAQYGAAIRRWRDELRRTDAWCAAEDAVGEAIAETGRHDAHWRMQERLFELFHASPWYTDRDAQARALGSEPAAHYLASSAAVALLVADAIDAGALRTLYAPFERVIPYLELELAALRSA